MKTIIRYIEHKSCSNADRGDAWIARVYPSKSGKTIYFNEMRLLRANVIYGNHICSKGEEYWVSGVKKSGSNRHWAGGGAVYIERSLVEWYHEHVQGKGSEKLIIIEDLPVPDIQLLSSDEHIELIDAEIEH